MNCLEEILSSLPDAIASPFQQWHRDEIIRELTRLQIENAHQERMQAMRLEAFERQAQYELAIQYLKTLQIGAETGNINPQLADGLKRLPLLLE